VKYIIIVSDGMEDNPVAELGNQTPLESANTTNMDHMSRNGRIGIVQTIPEGLPPGSDTGNLAVMGYNPKKCFSGRAPLEAANQGIELAPNQIAFRCNTVTVGNDKMIDYSAGHIKSDESEQLIRDLNKHINMEGVEFHPGKSYRHLLILTVRDPEIFMNIKTTPPHDIIGQGIAEYLPQGKESELLLKLMEESKEFLMNHPVNKVRVDLGENPGNMIWLWGQGTKPNIPSFTKKFGLKGSIISAVDLVNGIGRLAGLKVIDVPGITGYYDTNFLGKAEYALESLKENDFAFIHVEAPDEAGHNGDARAKAEAIGNIDEKIAGTILNHFNKHDDFRVLILSDHPTPVALRTHTSDPVSFVMFGKGIQHSGFEKFNEKTARKADFVFKSGEDLINYFIKRNI